jgi:hypothetical protein
MLLGGCPWGESEREGGRERGRRAGGRERGERKGERERKRKSTHRHSAGVDTICVDLLAQLISNDLMICEWELT